MVRRVDDRSRRAVTVSRQPSWGPYHMSAGDRIHHPAVEVEAVNGGREETKKHGITFD